MTVKTGEVDARNFMIDSVEPPARLGWSSHRRPGPRSGDKRIVQITRQHQRAMREVTRALRCRGCALPAPAHSRRSVTPVGLLDPMRGLAVLARDTCLRLEVSTVIEIGKFYVTDSPHRRRYWITSCLPGADIEYHANLPGRCFWKKRLSMGSGC